MPHERYDVLVATDAISEGENLQDAELVVNYDLSWTPLRLIQRVGRVNRFSPEKRKINVRNFFPGTDCYEKIVQLHARLRYRSQQVLKLSDVNYLDDGEQTPAWLAERSVAAVAQLYQAKSRTLAWANLVEEVGEVPSTEIPARLWAATPVRRREARMLPDGIQGRGYGRNPGLYVLLEIGRQRVALFRDDRLETLRSAPRPWSHEQLLAVVFDVTSAEAERDALDLDRAIGDLVQRWLADAQREADVEVTVLAALHIREHPR
jgi:hypothetical protein